MKIDASEMLAFYDSIEKLRWHTENLIEFARGISADNQSWPLKPLRGFIDGLGTGGVFAKCSQERNGYPLWGLDNLGELKRIAKFSHTFRLACPTPEKPMIWRKVQPAWSTAILDFCAYSVPVVMGGWEEDDFFGSDIPTWQQCRVASLHRLDTMAEQFVSAICKHFTSSVQRQLSTARVMLERESAWVCTEMRKSGVIGDFPDNQEIEEVRGGPELNQALTPPSAIGSSTVDNGPEPTPPDPTNLALWSRARRIEDWLLIIKRLTGDKMSHDTFVRRMRRGVYPAHPIRMGHLVRLLLARLPPNYDDSN